MRAVWRGGMGWDERTGASMSIRDVRDLIAEAEHLESAATDCRREAVAITRASGICAGVGLVGPFCCGDPDACKRR